MNRKLLLAALIAAPLMSAPLLAQAAPSAPPAGMAGAGPHAGHHMGGMGGGGMPMFPTMSEAGRKTVHEAMMAGGNRRDDRQKMAALREKMLIALEGERFDAASVKRAMDEERALAEATRDQRQSAMLAAFQKLSAEDRKAFVADSRAMKARMQQRMDGWRGRMRERMGRGGEPRPAPAPMD